jgi:hypothetical protein
MKTIFQRLEIRPAGRKSYCAHNKKHVIVKGEPRFIVKPPGIAAGEKGYCLDCAGKMLAEARAKLQSLEAALIGTTPT